MELAKEHRVKSSAFPSISTGAYGFPIELAAPIALRTVQAALDDTEVVKARFVLFTAHYLDIYRAALEALTP